eukprot:CAMPEP_0174877404 /NCGR_PEP_ID=MMETSP1114-20130205/81798_1 /TAXON_ID=312471 /ORGANISM="Neobodo designis, Strain CCAP 1951/1" /LENGTH=100 /DNA_ID=CAMNT_0016112783 /DNA_START=1 /DNA_END=300 /DNA_ORIENTATION=-
MALSASRTWFGHGCSEVPGWAAKDCLRALVAGSAYAQWEVAVTCFALSQALTPRENTQFGAFLSAAGPGTAMADVVLRSQTLLRASIIGRESGMKLDDPR